MKSNYLNHCFDNVKDILDIINFSFDKEKSHFDKICLGNMKKNKDQELQNDKSLGKKILYFSELSKLKLTMPKISSNYQNFYSILIEYKIFIQKVQ